MTLAHPQAEGRTWRPPLIMQIAGDCGLNAVRGVCAGEGVEAPADLYEGDQGR